MRCVFFQEIVNAVFVIIIDVVADQPAEMLFIERDHMVQDFPAATSDPAFGDTVLPGCLRASLAWVPDPWPSGTPRLGRRISSPYRRSRNDTDPLPEMPRATAARSTPALGWPVTLKMQDPASSMLDNEKAIEHLEHHRRHGEEVKCHTHLALMVSLSRSRSATNP